MEAPCGIIYRVPGVTAIEMAHYTEVAERYAGDVAKSWPYRSVAMSNGPFPGPGWVDTPYDGAAQLDAFRHIGSLEGATVLQIGGSGIHAVKFMLAGAS